MGYNNFLHIIRIGLWSDLPKEQVESFTTPFLRSPSELEWEEMYILASKQAVSGLFFEGCYRLPFGWVMPKELLLQSIGLSQQINYQNQEIDYTLSKCVNLLDSKNISTVLLKGQGLAYYYAKPSSRQCGDIDLYTSSKQEEALKVLLPHSDDGQYHENGKHVSLKIRSQEVELHQWTDNMSSRSKKAFRLWTEEALMHNSQKIIINKTQVRIPPVTYNVFYVFYHLYRHFMSSGVGLRQFCDLARLIHTQFDSIDQNCLKGKLKEYHLCKPWDLVMGILVYDLGLMENKAIFYSGDNEKARKRMTDMVMHEGNFGHYGIMNGRPSGLWAGKLFYFIQLTKRHFNIVRILPYNTIEYYINYIISGILKLINFVNKKLLR